MYSSRKITAYKPSLAVCVSVDSDHQAPVAAGGFSLHQGKELRWDQRLNLIGRPVINPLLHICEVCDLPVLIYGRMVRAIYLL